MQGAHREAGMADVDRAAWNRVLMDVCELNRAQDYAAWDEYVLAHPEGTFFHRAGWRDVITRSFGHRTFSCL